MKNAKENISPTKGQGVCKSLISMLVRPEDAPFLETLSLQPPDSSHKIEVRLRVSVETGRAG